MAFMWLLYTDGLSAQVANVILLLYIREGDAT